MTLSTARFQLGKQPVAKASGWRTAAAVRRDAPAPSPHPAAPAFAGYSWLVLLLLGIGTFLTGPCPSRASDTPSLEYKVKAAYLFNFCKFVEWPGKKLPGADTAIIIGVVGEDPFGDILEETVKGKAINGRKLVVKRFAPGEDIQSCDLLFISRSLKDSLDSILHRVGSQSVLTVSEVEKFAQRGGIINFIIVNDSVKCELNLDAAERAGLKISSKLASVARVIKSETATRD
jgi:hypothetical protein